MIRFGGHLAVLLLVSCVWISGNDGWRIDQYHDKQNHRKGKDDNDDNDASDLSNTKADEKELSDLPENNNLFEGDIVMDSRLRDAVLGRSKKAVMKGDIKWPHGVLVYDIEPDFLPIGRHLLEKAIHEFESRTCITFKRRTNEKDYVLYTSKENVCSSYIGRITGMQKIHIGKDCMVLGTVIHESMHALGFIHEHSRPDRDHYLDVKWENIDKTERSNFNKYTMDDVSNEAVEYNFASLMHYRNDAFTMNGKDTLVAKGEKGLHFGQRIKFSVGDVAGINHFYNCHERISKPNYMGLYKDYSGKRSIIDAAKNNNVNARLSEHNKRLAKVLYRFRERLFDWRRRTASV